MEKELLQKCNLIAHNASIVARDEIRLFCQIMDWSDADVYFVADDPHGVVSLGDYFFNMSDIHEVVANYPKLLERFGSNEELSNIIIRWYDWTLEYHIKHPVMDWQKVDQVNKFTGEKTKVLPIEECDYNGDRKFVLIQFEDRVWVVSICLRWQVIASKKTTGDWLIGHGLKTHMATLWKSLIGSTSIIPLTSITSTCTRG